MMIFSLRLFAVVFSAWLLVGALPAYAVEVQRVVSPLGVSAWLVEDHSQPVISLRLAFRGGARLDPEDKSGLANMVASTIDEGAGELDSQTFQGQLEELALTVRFDAGRDSFGGEMKTLRENRAQAFRLLGLALQSPRFDAEPVERIRSQIAASIRHESEDPDTIAWQAMMARVFANHPYGRLVKGDEQTLAVITRDDLRTYVRNHFSRDRLVVGIAGDISAEELAPLLDIAFGQLPATAPSVLPDVGVVIAAKTSGRVEVIERDVPQSAIVFAAPGVLRGDADFFPAYVLNHILGGGSFTSRLYKQVREERGLAYSVSSFLYPLDHAGVLIGQAGTSNARVRDTFDVVRAEWQKLQNGELAKGELEDAKTYLTGSFPLRFTSSGAIASILVGMQLDGLGMDYLDRRNGYINAVRADDIKRVAARLLAPDSLDWVIVGRPDGVQDLVK